MGTKRNPGRYDCIAKLGIDEPNFLLRAKDPLAADLVREWADRAQTRGVHEPEKIAEARTLADEIDGWRHDHH